MSVTRIQNVPGAIQMVKKKMHLQLVIFPNIKSIKRSPFAVGFTPVHKDGFRIAISDSIFNVMARRAVIQKIASVSNLF